MKHILLKLVLCFAITLLGLSPGRVFAVDIAPIKRGDVDVKDIRLVINIPSRTLWVYHKDNIIKYYPVGLGRLGFQTPTGQFKVIRMVENPAWENPYKAAGAVRIKPGLQNPLGTRWIGFHQDDKGEYGMHGTPNPNSVGQYSSHGCVRMKIPDVEDLYNWVSEGTPVEVQYNVALIREKDSEIRLVTYKDTFKKGLPSAESLQEKIRQTFPNAQVDIEKIRQALNNPIEQPITVGTLSTNQSETSPLPTVQTEKLHSDSMPSQQSDIETE